MFYDMCLCLNVLLLIQMAQAPGGSLEGKKQDGTHAPPLHGQSMGAAAHVKVAAGR